MISQQLPQLPVHFAALIEPIDSFLHCATPQAWLAEATRPENLQTLLVDHCNCELKAAQTGLLMMRRYGLCQESIEQIKDWTKPYEDYVYFLKGSGKFPDKKATFGAQLKAKDDSPFAQDIIAKMVALVKEELMHFEQVLDVMQQQRVDYVRLSASRYAGGMIKHVRTYEPAALMDKLIIGALIEARSCERFARLAPHLESSLATFYFRLLKSEARHYQDYLNLAQQVAQQDKKLADNFDQRVQELAVIEAQLITTQDPEFRFHSGVPVSNAA